VDSPALEEQLFAQNVNFCIEIDDFSSKIQILIKKQYITEGDGNRKK